MKLDNIFEGHIYLIDEYNNHSLFMRYSLPTNQHVPLDNCLMKNYSSFNFTSEEKKKLTQDDRKKIYIFKNLNLNQLRHDCRTFLEKIKRCKKEQIKFKTSGYGAFICLAAICTNQLPKNKKIEFELSSVPLALFPHKLSPKKGSRPKPVVTFNFEEKSWLTPFPSLYNCPECLHLRYHLEIPEQKIESKFAA